VERLWRKKGQSFVWLDFGLFFFPCPEGVTLATAGTASHHARKAKYPATVPSSLLLHLLSGRWFFRRSPSIWAALVPP